MAPKPRPDAESVPASPFRAGSHGQAGCCEHRGWFSGNRPSSGLGRSIRAWRHPSCPCCCQRRGGFHPGVRGGSVTVPPLQPGS